ncbi:MAG: hypothetical protein E7293_04240 [Lachnospiraceae bacterium]|nr:hypothetical protein [Lachnospiraceae bacterium]
MRKIWGLMLVVSLLFVIPMNVSAKEYSFVESGFTTDGIYYELYFGIYTDDATLYASDVVKVKVEWIFDSIIVPQATFYYTTEIDGYPYAGNLSLENYVFQGNKTIATYYGNLYKQ